MNNNAVHGFPGLLLHGGAFFKIASPNGRPLATITRVGREVVLDFGGPVATVSCELVSKRINASSEVNHEGGRPLSLRLGEFGLVLPASNSFACELIQHHPDLALATAVRIDRFSVIGCGLRVIETPFDS